MEEITLKTLPEKTSQEVFDCVAEHLLTQNKRSIKNGGCKYRGADGLKCAAGILISDEEYTPELDACGSWAGLVERNHAPRSHYDLICKLQDIHDGRDPEEWQEELSILARRFNLRPFIKN